METSNTGSKAEVLPELSAPSLLSTDTLDGALSASSQVLVIIIEFLNLLIIIIIHGDVLRSDSNITNKELVAMSTQQSDSSYKLIRSA